MRVQFEMLESGLNEHDMMLEQWRMTMTPEPGDEIWLFNVDARLGINAHVRHESEYVPVKMDKVELDVSIHRATSPNVTEVLIKPGHQLYLGSNYSVFDRDTKEFQFAVVEFENVYQPHNPILSEKYDEKV